MGRKPKDFIQVLIRVPHDVAEELKKRSENASKSGKQITQGDIVTELVRGNAAEKTKKVETVPRNLEDFKKPEKPKEESVEVIQPPKKLVFPIVDPLKHRFHHRDRSDDELN